jgi:hypothetical protein
VKNDELRHVLDHWDYPTAIALFGKYGKDPALLHVLERKESKFFTRKLREQLVNLITPDLDISEPAKKPKTILEIEKQRNGYLRQQDHLRGQNVLLVEMKAPQEEIAPVTNQIMELSFKLQDCFYKLNYFGKHGMLPPDPEDEVQAVFTNTTDKSGLQDIRNNYRTHVSRAKKGAMNKDKLDFYKKVVAEAQRRMDVML